MVNTISFEANNRRTMKLIQRQHNGKTLLVIEGPDGAYEIMDDEEAFIDPGDFAMLIDYYRACKRANKPIILPARPTESTAAGGGEKKGEP